MSAEETERLATLEERLETLQRTNATLVALQKATSHGAIRSGLRLRTQRGSRQLELEGGQLIAFVKDAQGDYEAKSCPVVAPSPLSFRIVSGHHVVSAASKIPELCAGADGETVPQPQGTYKVDLLFVIPDDETDVGSQPAIGWYLALGAPTEVNREADVDDIPSPPLPAADGVGCLPLYRIITRAGNRGITRTVQVANRVNGV